MTLASPQSPSFLHGWPGGLLPSFHRCLIFVLFGFAVAPFASAGSVLVGTGIPDSGATLAPWCGGCGQLYTGATGYVLDDRQRLAESFVFLSPVHVDGVEIGISTAGANSRVDVYITDGITTTGAQTANFFDAEAIFPSQSSHPQTVGFGTGLDLLPNVVYYIVLAGPFASATETNPGQSSVTSALGVLNGSYYANSGLGPSPIEASWASLAFPTVSFELTGISTPEPGFGPLVGLLLLFAVARGTARRYRFKSVRPE